VDSLRSFWRRLVGKKTAGTILTSKRTKFYTLGTNLEHEKIGALDPSFSLISRLPCEKKKLKKKGRELVKINDQLPEGGAGYFSGIIVGVRPSREKGEGKLWMKIIQGVKSGNRGGPFQNCKKKWPEKTVAAGERKNDRVAQRKEKRKARKKEECISDGKEHSQKTGRDD